VASSGPEAAAQSCHTYFTDFLVVVWRVLQVIRGRGVVPVLQNTHVLLDGWARLKIVRAAEHPVLSVAGFRSFVQQSLEVVQDGHIIRELLAGLRARVGILQVRGRNPVLLHVFVIPVRGLLLILLLVPQVVEVHDVLQCLLRFRHQRGFCRSLPHKAVQPKGPELLKQVQGLVSAVDPDNLAVVLLGVLLHLRV